MKVLITDIDSPIAQELALNILKSPKNQVIAAHSGQSIKMSLEHRNLRTVALDLRKNRQIKQLFSSPTLEGLTHVVHHPINTGADISKAKYHQLNVDSTRCLVESCEALPKQCDFIYFGSVEVYESHSFLPALLTEDHPINISPHLDASLAARIETDQYLAAQMGMIKTRIKLLRSAECLAPQCQGQLYSFLDQNPCFAPLGFDPMFNVISPLDLANAIKLSLNYKKNGVFLIPGYETLPLSEIIEKAGKTAIPLPISALKAHSWFRDKNNRNNFNFTTNQKRFRYGSVVLGDLAEKELAYTPKNPINWSSLSQTLST